MPDNAYRYNGKELDEATGLYDYGARYYDPAIGRFTGVDPIADQYAPISPYAYVGNNPVLLIDPDGMRIDVSGIMKSHPDEWEQVLTDLRNFTGLNLEVADGFLEYEVPEGKLGGSKSARNMLKDAIDHEETVTVLGCDNCASAVTTMDEDAPIEKQNEFTLSRDQINRFISGVSDDLDEKAYGFGVNFLHELGHTRLGGQNARYCLRRCVHQRC